MADKSRKWLEKMQNLILKKAYSCDIPLDFKFNAEYENRYKGEF